MGVRTITTERVSTSHYSSVVKSTILHSPLPTPHSSSFKRYRIDHCVWPDFLCALGDNSGARLQPVLNNPHRPHAVADLDWPNAHLVITAHNCDPIAALQFGDRSLRNEQRAHFRAGHRPDPAILTRAKSVPRVREDAGKPDSACFLIDLPVRDEESPFLRISRSVS